MKITKIEDKTFQGKVTGHTVTLADGTTGYLADKTSDNVRVGDDVTCTVEVKKNKKGEDYNLLTLKFIQSSGTPTPTPAPQGKIVPPNTSAISTVKSFAEMKFEGRLVCIKLAVECILQGRMERKEATEAFSEWVSVLDASIDELKSK